MPLLQVIERLDVVNAILSCVWPSQIDFLTQEDTDVKTGSANALVTKR